MVKGTSSHGQRTKKSHRHRLMQFAESQLVLASLEKGSCGAKKKVTITRTMRDLAPTLVTPSPIRQSNQEETSHSTTVKKNPRKQLFTSVALKKQQIIQEEEDEEDNHRVSVKKRLFTENAPSSTSVPCSSAPRIPDEWLLQQVVSTRPLPPPNLHRRPATRLEQRLSKPRRLLKPIDSLAAISSSMGTTTVTLTAKRKAKIKTIRRRRKNKNSSGIEETKVSRVLKEKETRTTKENDCVNSEIPPELVSVLAPLGLSRKPRTGKEILEEEKAGALQQSIPTRERMPRACKEKRKIQNYSEESDIELESNEDCFQETREQSNTTQQQTRDINKVEFPPNNKFRRQGVEDEPFESRSKYMTRSTSRKSTRRGEVTAVLAKHQSKAKITSKHQQPDAKLAESRPRAALPPPSPRLDLEVRKKKHGGKKEKSNDNNLTAPNTNFQNSVVKFISESPKRKKSSKSAKRKKAKRKSSKVRFAPLPTATTTFSVKIRVKTSAGKTDKSMINQPHFSQSMVQRIANQITQACLAQVGNINSNSARLPSVHTLPKNDITPLTQNLLENGNNIMPNQPSYLGMREEPLEVDFDCDASVISDLTREKDFQRESSPPQEQFYPEQEEGEDDAFVFEPGFAREEPVNPPLIHQNQSFKRSNRDGSISLSNKRHCNRRVFKSSDSLASLSFADRSGPPQVEESKVPKEVSVNRSPTQVARRGEKEFLDMPSSNHPKNVFGTEPIRRAGTEHIQKLLPEIDDTVVTDQSASSFIQCNKCSGCQQKFDCMHCNNCIARIQRGDFYSYKKSDCLKRVCQEVEGQTGLDSLGKESKVQPKDSKKERDDDDFSYLSEVEWGSRRPNPTKRLSRAARLWSSGYIGKQKSQRQNGGSVSSVTSLTGIGASKQVTVSVRKRGGRGMKKGKKKDPLHDMEMSLPADGSVASWMEGRKKLRALMHYDEADQDWV